MSATEGFNKANIPYMFVLQQSVEATGTFDPVGTVVALLILVLGAWAARAGWRRYQAGAGTRSYGWLALAGIAGFVAVITAVSFLLNIAAALRLM